MVSVARPSSVAVIRVIGATERRFFTIWPFITIGAKSALVSMSIVQTSKSIKRDDSSPKTKGHLLAGPDLAFAGGMQKMGSTIRTISFIVKIWISQTWL